MLVTKQAPSDLGEDGNGSSPSSEGVVEGGADGGEAAGSGGGGGGGGVPLVELKSFTTQAFFTCWRAVHLGLLQVSWRFCFSRTLSIGYYYVFVSPARPVGETEKLNSSLNAVSAVYVDVLQRRAFRVSREPRCVSLSYICFMIFHHDTYSP